MKEVIYGSIITAQGWDWTHSDSSALYFFSFPTYVELAGPRLDLLELHALLERLLFLQLFFLSTRLLLHMLLDIRDN